MPGFHRILLPVDFAAASKDIINSGFAHEVDDKLSIEVASTSLESLALADQLVVPEGEIRLVHATPALDHTSVYGGSLSGHIEEIHKNATEAALKCLQSLAKAHVKHDNVTFHAKPGSSTSVVLDEAQAFGAELIVLAASGRSRAARFFLGSTADRVIREAPCPVLVVPNR